MGPSSDGTLWFRHLTAGGIRVGPVENATEAYIADALGNLDCVNLSNGSVRWSRGIGLNPTTPDLTNGELVVASGSGGSVVAVDAATGALRWSSTVNDRVSGPVSVVGGEVVVGTADGRLVALTLANGSWAWSASLGASVAGAVAYESGRWFAATDAGGLFAVDATGRPLWTANVSAPVDAGPAVAFGRVVLGDLRGNVSAYNASTGTLDWRFRTAVVHPGDGVESTVAVAASGVYFATDLGAIDALDLATGALRWSDTVAFTGYPVTGAPVVTVNGLYVWDASETLDDLALGTGRSVWSASLAIATSFSSPAVAAGTLLIGDEKGYLWYFGGAGTGFAWNVSGNVTDTAGRPVPGSTIAAFATPFPVASDGSFLLELTNGSYTLTATAPGYDIVSQGVTVTGPVGGLVFRLAKLPLYPITGVVEDQLAVHGLSRVLVQVTIGLWTNRSYSGADGSFTLWAPNGTTYVTVAPPPGYSPVALHVVVAGAAVSGVVIGLEPTDVAVTPFDGWRLDVLLPLAALAAAGGAAGFLHASRRRTEEGLAPDVTSPFARFVAMRLLLVPAQAAVVLTLLFVFGTFLPVLARPSSTPCQIASAACSGCSWEDFQCAATAFFQGLWTLIVNLFTGQWGLTSFGNLQEEALLFLQWWLPYSVELALFALLFSAIIAYPLGLLAGWWRDSPIDNASRNLSNLGLFVPTFLVLLFVLAAVYGPFSHTFGDTPYDVIPSPSWFAVHGQPDWIGTGFNTSPTGFPLADGAIHGDWAFERIVLVKTVLQALVIALIYVGIFLRYARNAVVEAVQEPYVNAARARGIPEGTLLWRHTARRVWPIYVLVFGLTIPAFIGTQAVVEALANDHGVGTLLIAQMTHVQSTSFGFSSIAAGPHIGNLYQVLIFILVLVVLLGKVAADVLARYLDPRIVRKGGA